MSTTKKKGKDSNMATAKAVKKPSVRKPFLVESKGEDIANKTVCLKVRFGSLGNSRRVSSNQVEVDADKALINVNKTLLDSKELRAVRNADVQLRIYLQSICLPYDIGVFFVPLALVPTVEAELKKFEDARGKLVAAFIAVYPELCKEAKSRLRGVFSARDYPPVQEVAKHFTFSYQYISFGVPGQLKKISAAMFEREAEKAQQVLFEATNEVQRVMRETLAEMVAHLADRLSDDSNGKPKRLHATAVEKLREFLDMFDMRNVVNDVQLKKEVEKARSLLTNVDAEKLRNVDTLRLNVRQGLDKIKTELSTLVVDAPTRKIKLVD